MGVKNLYSNLPGHLVEFKDGGLQLTSDTDVASSGASLLILGTALDGPVNEPVKISESTVAKLFGPDVNEKGFPNGTTLTKYAKQAFKNGFTDVRCMRVTGSQSSVEITKPSSAQTEAFDGVPVSGVIAGNDAATFTTDHVPVYGSLNITTMNGSPVATNVSNYTGQYTIEANSVSKNSQLAVNYQYQNINQTVKTETDIPVSADGGVTVGATYALTKVAAGEQIFKVAKMADGTFPVGVGSNGIPATEGVVITLGGTTLVEGTDYTVNYANNEVTFLSTGQLVAIDEVTIEYYTCTLETHNTTITLNDTDQTVAILSGEATVDNIVEESIVVTVNGQNIENTKYTYANGIVTFTAGNFALNASATITYQYEKVVDYAESMIVRSIYGGTVYNGCTVAISEYPNPDDPTDIGRLFTFTKPASKLYTQGEGPMTANSFDYPTLGALKQAMDNYSLNNVFEIITDNEDTATSDFAVGTYALIGGTDGINPTNNEMFEALSGKRNAEGYLTQQGAYQILENYHVDYVYPAGVYADSKQTVNKYSNFHRELALLCAVLTYRTKMTHGFIDVKPNANTTLVGIQNHVNKLLQYNNVFYMQDAEGNDIVDEDGNKMDIGWYTSLVVGPEPVMNSDTLGKYYGSPAIAYAALCGSINPESSPTNKAVPGVTGMKYKLSNKQLDALVGNRMVVFKLKNEGTTTATSTPYVVDGCTCGGPNCDYKRISTVKIVTDVVDQIREVADPFIGEPNTVEQRNALSALISKRLSYLLTQGEIQYYNFEIDATVEQVLLGECSIALTLVCPMELRKITTVVALRASA